ncbi:hypothetical protein niasHS_000045 [Heterodera schachtii]|uniref:Uncharacterized protein n=1 Tax=Heterodera schachtii TaxID=97005 RepID=A0ABD2K6W8_HETSC
MFKHPFTMCVAGCTGSGKSQWVDRLLSHIDLLVSEGPITGVLYCYGEVNDNVLRMQRMESATSDNNTEGKHSLRMCHGAPEEGDVEREARATGGRLLLVLDDLMSGGLRCGFLDTVFTRGSHNWSVSVVLITQHLFTRELRIARNNCHYTAPLPLCGSSSAAAAAAEAPPGYKTFVNNAHDDLQMWRLLFPDERAAVAGSDSASTVGGQPRRHQPLRGQKKTGAGRFSLSLLQPKQHAHKSVQKTSIMVIGGSNVVARSLTVESLLDPIYKDERSPACFTSVEPLLREAKRRHPDARLTRAEVTRYLAGQRVYTLHRQVRRRFRRLPTLASGLHTDWQADLADFQRLRAQNRGYAYLLVCIDTLSRQVYVQPVKSKRSDDMITALKRTFARCGYTPWRLLTDKGREFTASAVQRYLRDEAEVRHHCMETSPLWHAGMAERANRSIKERLYRYFTHRGTQCWTRVIQRIVSSLNASPNSSIFGMRPNEVCFENAESLRQRIADRAEAERSGRASQHPRSAPATKCALSVRGAPFAKATCLGSRTKCSPWIGDGEPITGLFYANDMCLVLLPPSLDDSSSIDQRKTRKRLPDDSDNNKVYAIERILERRYRKDGTECCLIKWKGYSTRHNSWIPAHTII